MLTLKTLILSAGLAALAPVGHAAQASCADEHAIFFDGIDDRVTVPYDATFPGAVFTVAAWIRTSLPVGPTREAIIARGEDDLTFDGPWFLMMSPQGALEVQIENNVGPGQNAFYSSGVIVDDGQWHHVAASRDLAGSLVFYVDGVAVATIANTLTPSPDNQQVLSIGCTHGTMGAPPPTGEPPIMFFHGTIEEPAMWSVSLSATQISDVFRIGVDSAPSGLVGHWDLNEGAGQQVFDLSPAGNHGVLGESGGSELIDPAWVDAPAHCSYGCDINPPGSLAVVGGRASVGTIVTLGIQDPLGVYSAGAASILALSLSPQGSPCGPLVPGWGMAGGVDGELLVSLSSGGFLFVQAGTPWPGPGTFSQVPLAIPQDASLSGLSVFGQGVLLDSVVGIGLTTPLELVIGP